MCLALPAKVLSIDKEAETAVVALGPVRKEISTALLDEVTPGDYVLIHVGYALHRVSPEEAERTLAMIREAGENAELAALVEGAPVMKYVDEFRDRDLAEGLAKAIRHEATATRRYHVMEFCGGHTHAIFRYGVQDLMPENVDYRAWPRLPGLCPAHRPHR